MFANVCVLFLLISYWRLPKSPTRFDTYSDDCTIPGTSCPSRETYQQARKYLSRVNQQSRRTCIHVGVERTIYATAEEHPRRFSSRV